MSTDYRYQQECPLRAGSGEDLPQSVPGTTTGPLASSPSRTKSGSQASASTVPSRRTTAGAVTTGRQNTASSPADGTCPPAVTVLP